MIAIIWSKSPTPYEIFAGDDEFTGAPYIKLNCQNDIDNFIRGQGMVEAPYNGEGKLFKTPDNETYLLLSSAEPRLALKQFQAIIPRY